MSAGPTIRLALAFDHELSLGGASNYDRNLFDPTHRLIEAAQALGVRIVLFTDVLCAIAHERWEIPAFITPYRRSLTEALRAGHDVQLHLHPHWLTSRWERGTFTPSRDFALADFAHDKNGATIESIVHSGVDYLRELLQPVDPAYRAIAFRAGGYNIAPHTGRIFQALAGAGIRIDSSIIKGYRFASGLSEIDYTDAPARANWEMHGLIEVPIASSPRTPVNNLPFLVRRVLRRNRRSRDAGHGIHDGATSTPEKLRRLFPRSAWPLSFDNYADGGKDVFGVFRRYVEAHAGEREIICSSVSHPKSMGVHARSVFADFVERARDAYGERLRFETFPEIAERLPMAVP